MESVYGPIMLDLKLAVPLLYTGEVKRGFDDYIEMVEAHNRSEGRRAEVEFDRALRNEPEEFHSQVEDYFISLLERHRSLYPQFLYESIFIMIYKHFENSLKQAVEIIYGITEEDSLSVPQYRNDIIGNYFGIVKLFCLTAPSDSRWSQIRNYQKLRNKIVHNKPHEVITKELVLSFNLGTMEFMHLIYRSLKVPDESPNRSILERPLDNWPSQVVA